MNPATGNFKKCIEDIYGKGYLEAMEEERKALSTCKHCGNEIDRDVCNCGIPLSDHDCFVTGHSFVPMGCGCFFEKPDLDFEALGPIKSLEV